MGAKLAGNTHGQAPVARYGHRNAIHSTWTSVNRICAGFALIRQICDPREESRLDLAPTYLDQSKTRVGGRKQAVQPP